MQSLNGSREQRNLTLLGSDRESRSGDADGSQGELGPIPFTKQGLRLLHAPTYLSPSLGFSQHAFTVPKHIGLLRMGNNAVCFGNLGTNSALTEV